MEVKVRYSKNRIGWLVLFVLFFVITKTQAQEKPEVVVQIGHQKDITALAISPDGKYLLSGSNDNSVILWDALTGKELKTFVGHTNKVVKVVLSPDGKQAKSWSWDRTLRIWDLISGKEVKTLDYKEKYVQAVSNDLKVLLVCDQKNKKVLFVDAETGNEIKAFSVRSSNAWFSNDDKILVLQVDESYSDPNSKYEFRDVESFGLKHYTSIVKSASITDISPDGKKYLVVDYNTLKLYDMANGNVIKTITNDQNINAAKFTSDGKGIIYATTVFSPSINIFLYDSTLENKLQTFSGAIGDVNAFAWTNDVKSVIVGANNILHFDITSGKLIKSFRGYSSPIIESKFSPDGKLALFASETTVSLFDIQNGKLVKAIEQPMYIHSADFLPDGKSMVASSSNRIIHWDIESGEPLKEFSSTTNQIKDMQVSPDGKTLITANWETMASLYDLSQKSQINTIKDYWGPKSPLKVKFSPNGKLFGLISDLFYNSDKKNLTVKVFDVTSDKELPIQADYDNGLNDFAFSPDGCQIITVGNRSGYSTNSLIKLWNVNTSQEIGSFGDYSVNPKSIGFSPDSKSIVVGYQDGTIKIWDAQTKAEVRTFGKHNLPVTIVSFSPDGECILSTSLDNTSKLWDASTGKLIYTLVFGMGQEKQWIIFNDEGYWDGSPNCGDLVTMVKGIENWGIDQFAVKNNRPDKILANYPGVSPDLINHLKTQYLKRLKKQGYVDKSGSPNESLVSSDYHLPTSKIIESKQNDKFVDLKINLNDTKYNLKQYNIFVNDVPLYGAAGKSVQGKFLETTEKIELTAGDNKIEVSCTNDKDAESYRAITYYTYNPVVPVKKDLYFIGFGVSKYNDPALNLNYADKDAKDLGELFSKMKDHFSNVYSIIYTNEECTVEKIKKAKDLVKNAKPDDILVLFIAGHGMHDTDKDETYYYLTYNTDLKNLKGTAANFETIEDILQGIPPRNKLFLMDACESGEVEDDIDTKTQESFTNEGIASRGFKVTSAIASGAKQSQASAKRTYLYQKDRFIYNDLTRRSGAIVFSSSKGGEFSYESSTIGNGFFTYQIINALKGAAAYSKGLVSVDALKEYVIKTVSNFSQGKQNPTVDRDNIYQKFTLPVILSSNAETDKNMVFVKGGKFMNKLIKYFGTDIKVNSFYMGKFEVTQKEWKETMPTNPSKYVGDSLPVDNVNWYECVEYCNLRSIKEGLEPYYTIDKVNIDKSLDKKIDNLRWRVTPNENANGYRLPTEMEWRYAASGGQLSNWYTLSGSDELTEIAEAENNIFKQNTYPVGRKKPNELGIYDMMGNVYEWCWDWNPKWVKIGYGKKAEDIGGKQRLILGDWSEIKFSDNYQNYYISINKGFRVVRNAQ